MNAAIRGAVDVLIDLGLLEWGRVASLQPLGINQDFNRICLSSEANYEEVYKTGLSLRHFNFCLFDHSYFQLSNMGGSLRLAYYPNPFVDPYGLLELIDDPLDFDAFEIDELRATAGRAPVRFDLSPSQYRNVVHPYAHFHLGHGELGRLPSRRNYCAYSFVLLIIRLYYPEAWSSKDCGADAQGYTNSLDAQLASKLATNGLIGAEYFSALEERLVHVR